MPDLVRRPLLAAILIGLAAQILFGWHVTRPSTAYFDEVHYLPAARSILLLEQPRNTEHPMLGKELIAGSIAVFGDDALGWRAASTVAGSLSVVAVFAILMLLFGSVSTAAYGALFAALNVTLYVHARIAMLEPFLGMFVLWGIAALLWAMRGPPERVTRRWLAGAVLLGAATAVKWTAAPYVAMAGFAFWVLKVRRPALWPGLSGVAGLTMLGAASVAAYFATFLPAFFYATDPLTPGRLIPLQYAMFEQQTQVLPAHPYQSNWWTWPLMIRPIWYLYERVDGAVRGVLLIGNPAILCGGLVAVAYLGWRWLKRYDTAAGAVALLWVASLAIWAAIPKSLGFFYYYHLSAIFLAIALAAAFHRCGNARARFWFAVAAGVLFVWFYPIVSAEALPDDQAFNRWMWFPSWR